MITIAVLKVYWVSVRKFASANDRWHISTNCGKNIILRENTHNVRNFYEISNENRKTVKYGIETISIIIFFRANLTSEYNLATSLHDFKLEIKNWHCDKCVWVMPKFSTKYRVFIKLLT